MFLISFLTLGAFLVVVVRLDILTSRRDSLICLRNSVASLLLIRATDAIGSIDKLAIFTPLFSLLHARENFPGFSRVV